MTHLKLVAENAMTDLRSSDGKISYLTQAALLFFLLTLTATSASIQDYLKSNLDQMLGSDMVLESHVPLEMSMEHELRTKALGVSKTEVNSITLTHGDKWARVQLKLVDDAYPLQGDLQVASGLTAEQNSVSHGPGIGEMWVGTRLSSKLGIHVGEQISFAGRNLTVTNILFHEPDRILEGHSVAMRAMVHSRSLAGLSLGASNNRTRYLVTADSSAQAEIETWTTENLPGVTILKKYGGQHPLAGFWRRTENFLGLASVILFFMGAVALDMTNRRWLAKMRYRSAIYASFGTNPRTAMGMALGSWFFAFLASVVLAGLLAIAAHSLIVGELQTFFPGLQAGFYPLKALKTVALVFALLLALQIPSFLQLKRASLLSLIRSTNEGRFVWHRLAWGLISVSMLAAAYSDNWLLTAMTLTAIAVSLVFMAVLTWVVLWAGDFWGRRRAGLLPFTFFIMRQRVFSKSAQIIGLGLCGLLLLFTMMLMRDLGTMMESYGRTQNGNLVIAEAQENHVDAIRAWAAENGSEIRQLRPFVSAKLISVNGQALADYMQKPSDTLSTLQDPIRLSWSKEVPDNNKLVSGNWWASDTPDWRQLSTEPEVMTDMGFKFGDTLTYQIGEQMVEFTLVASHAYKPGGGSVTFWFQMPATARAHIDAPSRYMGSMELPTAAWNELAGLWQRYPTLSLLPLKELTERFDRLLAVVTKVTSGYAGMVLLLALFVVAAAVSGFRADDSQKNGLLMSMGLRNSDCLKLNFYDWGITASIAAAGAVAGTWIAGHLLYEEQFGLGYNPDPVWVMSVLTGMVLLVCAVGYISCRQSLKVSVRDLMAD